MGLIFQVLNLTGEKYYIIYNPVTVAISKTMNQIEKIKLHINFATKDTPWGGGNSFLRNLKGELSKKGNYINDKTKANVIIFNAHHHLLETLKLKRKFPDKIFIHRLGGPMKGLRKKGRILDFLIQRFNEKISDGVIFQSKWSMKENISVGYSKGKFFKVIPNGVNSKIFNKKNRKNVKKKKKIKIVFASWSNNPTKGLSALKYLDAQLDFRKYDLDVFGNFNINFKNISSYGPKNPNELSNILKKSDIFLFASKKEAYSNMLIEAIATGVPVITLKSSSNIEIVMDNRLLFSSNSQLIKKINYISTNLNSKFKYKVFSLNEIAEMYVLFSKNVADRLNKNKIKKINFIDFLKLSIIYYFLKIILFL